MGLYSSENRVQKFLLVCTVVKVGFKKNLLVCAVVKIGFKKFLWVCTVVKIRFKKMIVDIYVFYFYKLFVEIVFIESRSEKEFV